MVNAAIAEGTYLKGPSLGAELGQSAIGGTHHSHRPYSAQSQLHQLTCNSGQKQLHQQKQVQAQVLHQYLELLLAM